MFLVVFELSFFLCVSWFFYRLFVLLRLGLDFFQIATAVDFEPAVLDGQGDAGQDDADEDDDEHTTSSAKEGKQKTNPPTRRHRSFIGGRSFSSSIHPISERMFRLGGNRGVTPPPPIPFQEPTEKKATGGTDVLDGDAVRLVVGVVADLALGVGRPPDLFEGLQRALVEQTQDGVVELVAQRRALLHGQRVRLARELLADHVQVAVGQLLVADVRRIACSFPPPKKKQIKKQQRHNGAFTDHVPIVAPTLIVLRS